MSAASTRPARGDGIAAAWKQHAPALAAWADANLVNRRDSFGRYLALEARTPEQEVFTAKEPLTLAILQRHFIAASTGHLIGLHSTVRDDSTGEAEVAACWSRWLAIDIDRHDDAIDPETTTRAALALHDRIADQGFSPLLLDSNGRGGFHLLALFDAPVATAKVFAFAKWIRRDWENLGLDADPETFPKQPSIGPGGFGNWFRLPGRHHTREHFTKVWRGGIWLEGLPAVKAIIEAKRSPAELIPREALKPARPPRGKAKSPAGSKDAKKAAKALDHLDASMPYPEWLTVGMALTPLGREGLALWDRWSSASDKYREGICDRKWRSFKREGVALGTLFHMAKLRGFELSKGQATEVRPKANPVAEPTGPKIHRPSNGCGDEPPDDGQAGGGSGEPIAPNEADDDPHRLARVYLDGLRRPQGTTLLFWREEYHRWDGTHYRICPDKEVRGELTSAVKSEFDRLNVDAIRICDPDRPLPVAKPVTTRKIGDVLQALNGEAMLRVVDCPEQPAWLVDDPPFPAGEVLPCRNALVHMAGMIDGRAADDYLASPTPAFFSPYALDFDFLPDAPPPSTWLSFLETLWANDRESVETLQEWFGYSITTDTSHQKMLMMIGPKRSGRGTISRVLTTLLGPANVANPTLSGFSTHFGAASLIGKQAAIFTDARISGRSDVAVGVERLLSITGEDPQTIPRKNREDWNGRLRTRFTLISNELPKLTDVSGAISSRMIILRLTECFLGREDKDLERKLRAEMPGILLWAIAGWRRLRERGRFLQPVSADDLVEQMADLSSPVGEFVRDRCVIGPACEVFTPDLFAAWQDWCNAHGKEHKGDASLFGRNLKAAFHSVRTSKPTSREGRKGRLYQGIDLNPEERSRLDRAF